MGDDRSALELALAGRYRLEREAGAGGMATVFAAEDLRHGRRVALKFLKPELAATLGPERFRREIEIAARLSHPHIVPLFDSGSAGGVFFYVMPLIEGESLRDRLQREPRLPVSEVVRIADHVADALGYAHRQGIVHRDIKPDNILLAGEHALVSDFGIARAIEAAGSAKLTQTGFAVGTAAYMSPEQASGSTQLDARSDLYSLGCVLFETLAGRPPFTGAPASVIYQHISAEPPALAEQRPELPASLARVVARLLAKVPADRFATAEEVRSALNPSDTSATTLAVPRRPAAHARGRAVLAAGIAAAAALATALAIALHPWSAGSGLPAIRSLAVMPLENLSGDPSQGYFADGVTEELINQVSRITSLRVISRASVMTLRGSKLSVPELSRKLAVDAVVEGSVAREGTRVKVTAELIQPRPERELWSRSLEGEARDLMGLQGELATAIADELRLRLSPTERARVAQNRPVDPEAHEAYLRGRYDLNKRDEKLFQQALQFFQRSVQIDSTYAPGWAGVADAYYELSNVYLPPMQAMPKAREAAERALRLDPNLGEAHAALGIVHFAYDWDWKAAEREFRLALALNPSGFQTQFYYAYFLETQGRFDESIEHYKEATRLDPMSHDIAAQTIYPSYLAGRDEDVIAECTRQLRADPQNPRLQYNLGQALEAEGRYPEAIAELERAHAHDDYPAFTLALLCHAFARAGQRGQALAALKQLQIARGQRVPAIYFAIAYSGLGDRDHAFQWLEKAYANRDEDLVLLKVEPKFAALRGDPRYRDLLRRMQLEG